MPRKAQPPRSLIQFAEGRDSLQLAEFPLAILADSAPLGVKTIEFEDTIEDWSTGKTLQRKVSITGSDKFGLPTAKDEDVLLALIQLTKLANDFTNPEVRFTKREIIDLLGWPNTGWAHERVTESLHRWKGVSIHHFNSFRDRANKCWKNSVAMGVIEYTEIETYTTDRRSEVVRATTKSSIIWNRKLFESFSSGYVKKLNFAIYRNLKRPAAKRAYRFLDKRFFHSPNWEFDLKTFACEKLGLSRAYDTGQLKERLKPALDELQNIGFIEPVEYRKQRPKHWTIAVSKKEPTIESQTPTTVEQASLAQELIAREVGKEVAQAIVKQFPEAIIREKIAFFDQLVAKNDPRINKNPPGFLIAAIKRDFKPTKSDSKRPPQKTARELKPAQRERIEALSKEDAELLASLSKLSPEGVIELTQRALAISTPIQVATLERLSMSRSKLLPEFRMQLMMNFVRKKQNTAA